MRKLINLVALVMLVSVNVLTPFTYAGDEIVENEVENSVELGEISENDEIVSENDEITSENENITTENDEKSLDDEITLVDEDMVSENPEIENDENLELSEIQEPKIMEVISGTSATLLSGQEFNVTLKELAGQSNATYSTSNTTIQQIFQWTGDTIPSGVTTGLISATGSDNEVVAWFDNGTIYYYTEAETIYMNSYSSYMFYYMQGLTGLDLSSWDTSSVTNMSSMFYQCSKLVKLDLSNWDTSNVKNMASMFNNCTELETVYASTSFETNQVTNFYNTFYNIKKLVGGNGSRFDKIGGTYAKIDIEGQTGYFTDKNAITTRFLSDGIVYENQPVIFGESAIKPADPTKEGAVFKKWVDYSGYEYEFENNKIEKYTEIYATFNSNEAILKSGQEFNVTLKELAGQSNATYSTSNTTIQQIIQWSGGTIPSGVTTGLISATYSDNDVIAWFDGGIIYYYTDAEIIYMNPDSSYMFYYIQGLTGLDLSSWDTSSVTNMSSMFYQCSKLKYLDLSNWDTSKVTSMGYMFYQCSNLETIYASTGFISTGVTSSSYMFSSDVKLVGGNGTKFNSSKIDKVYAKADTQTQSGYFTNKNDISVRFISENTEFETQVVNYGGNVSKPTIDPDRQAATFKKWVNESGEEFDFENTGIKRYVEVYAKFDSNEALLLPGNEFNQTVKRLAGQNNATYGTTNTTIKQIVCTGTVPTGVTTGLISIPYSDNDIVARYDSGDAIIYYYTDAEIIYMNPDSSYMFYYMQGLTGLDLSSWNTSKVTYMSSMFYNDNKLEDLNLSNWNTSSVTNMHQMFSNCKSLTGLDLSSFDTSSVTNMSDMFYNCSLTGLDLSSFDTSSVKNMSYMFSNCINLKEIKGLDTFNTSNVTDMYEMFYYCTSLTGLDLSDWDTSNVQSMSYMFGHCENLEYLNLNGRDFRGVTSVVRMGNILNITPQLKKLDMGNTKFTGSMYELFAALNIVEEINLSGVDTSSVTNMQELFYNCKNLKEIKGLDTWDTSNVTNMYEMFYNCYSLTGLDLSSFNTSKVRDMGYMFNNCSSLTGLDLSNFDTSNVTSISSIIYGCASLEELNLSGWDLSKVQRVSASDWGWNSTSVPLKKLNMTNVKFSGNISYIFNYAKNLEELILDGVDTSNVTDMHGMFASSDKLTSLDLSSFDTSKVTDMNSMFYYCSSLTGLDLSSFDTSNVTNMGSMFYNIPSLRTIYASNKFVTTALSYNPTSMFYDSRSIVGGNGTKFDSGYIDKTYALIDKVGQTGYFTDKNAITVKFINTMDGTESYATFVKGQELTPSKVEGYHVAGGYLDEAMTQAIDLKKGVDSYSEIYVKYERNGSSGGGGGGGGGGGSSSSSSTGSNTPEVTPSQSAGTGANISTGTQNDQTTTGTIVNEPEGTGNNAEIQTGSGMDSSEQVPQNDNDTETAISNDSEKSTNSYSTEFQQAYEFAKGNGITTMPTIQKADMNGNLTRIAMAKMLSQYAMNVLGQKPANIVTPKFNDVSDERDEQYDNGVTLAYQLGIMGQNMPGNNFRPDDEVTRAEFATALSRMLYATSDGQYKSTSEYYTNHMKKLKEEGIITKDNPKMKELRGYVMIMLMRSAENN